VTLDLSREDDWNPITPTAPYTSTDATYRINGSGDVEFRGSVARGGAADGATLFTLPAEYWPSSLVFRDVIPAPLSATAYLRVTTTGVVSLHERAGTVTDYQLNSAAPFSAF